ncbi:hypothetical protein R8Z57_14865 [Microbacterium sp. M3]|uniref:Uncharacterized protein n=1 Tax=Microbacterium arthrosphaerae TaxID=792652 RepID=A0ABU4H3Z4_9MICO|nr:MULTISPECIES: hypothetical protein [Microbacterium]MDW4574060.1 hypothetical protein [Microbacterium arthrosphaerae]MDW7607915.1 hypothetical protein [Microbacterium sp. M3]
MSESVPASDPRRRSLPLGVVMVGMVAVSWWPAFTLGAWGEIFFDDVLALWAASTAAFVFVLVERRPVGGRLARAFVLLLPSVWLVLQFVTADETTDIGALIVDLAALAAVLLGIPFTLWVLVGVVWPDLATSTRARTKWLVALVVLGIAIASFVLGLNQQLFLTCEDFAISGNSEPPGCVHDSTPAG